MECIDEHEENFKEWLLEPSRGYSRECELVTIAHPCVNKATAHLELLQNAITDSLCSNADHTCSSGQTSRPVTSQPSSTSHTSQLEVVGSGVAAASSGELESVGFMTADEVVEEVLRLLKRLELDRRNTEEALELKRGLVVKYSRQIDKMAVLKMEELPKAVQLEHDRIVADLNEMHWHVAYNDKKKSRTAKRLKAVTAVNTKLREDIAHIKEYQPLVQDKLELELSIMDDINRKTKQKLEEQIVSNARRGAVTIEKKEMVEKTAKKREQMQIELTKAKKELQIAKTNLEHSESRHGKLVRNLGRNRDAMVTLTTTLQRARDRKVAAVRRSERLHEVEDELAHQMHNLEAEHRALDEANRAAREIQEKEGEEMEAARSVRKELLENTEDTMVVAIRGNQELEMEIEDMAAKIKKCADQEIRNEQSTERIKSDLITTGQERGSVMEELWGLGPRHNEVSERLEKREAEIAAVEEHLKTQLNQLNQQIQVQERLKTSLTDRIKTGKLELIQDKKDAKVVRTETKNTVMEVERSLRKFRKETDTLRATAASKRDDVDRLEREKKEIAEIKVSFMAEMQIAITALTPDHSKISEAHLRLERQLERLNWQTRTMAQKLEEIRQTTVVIKRGREKIEKEAAQLDKIFSEVNIERMKKQQLEKHMKAKVAAFIERMTKNSVQHSEFILERENYLKKSSNELERTMAVNKSSAKRYRLIQNEFYLIKENYLNIVAVIGQFEQDVKDVKQIHSLQNHMHHEESIILQLQDAYHNARLALCQADFDTNSQQVKAVVTTMNDRVDTAVSLVEADRFI